MPAAVVTGGAGFLGSDLCDYLRHDPHVRQPEITRARQILGWEPTNELEEGLRRMTGTQEREATRV